MLFSNYPDDTDVPTVPVKRFLVIAMCSVVTGTTVIISLFTLHSFTFLSASSTLLSSRRRHSTPERTIPHKLNRNVVQGYNCIGERMNHNQKMLADTFLCASSSSSGKFYVFGMDSNGNLIWSDVQSGVKRIYFENKDNDPKSIYFMLTVQGKFRIYNVESGKIVWGKKPKSTYGKIVYGKCLEKYACPYLHQHAGGVCVINWIDENNTWMQKNINRVYEFRERMEYF